MSSSAPARKKKKKTKARKTEAADSLGVAPPQSFCGFMVDATRKAMAAPKRAAPPAAEALAPLATPPAVAAANRAAVAPPPAEVEAPQRAPLVPGVDYGKWDRFVAEEAELREPRPWERSRKPEGRAETWDERAMREHGLDVAVQKGGMTAVKALLEFEFSDEENAFAKNFLENCYKPALEDFGKREPEDPRYETWADLGLPNPDEPPLYVPFEDLPETMPDGPETDAKLAALGEKLKVVVEKIRELRKFLDWYD